MEMINVKELSEIDILQLQFSILEELKQKQTNDTSDKNPDVIKYISKRFKDKDGIYESDKYYYYRQMWFENGCCSYRKLGKIVGKSHVNLQQIAKRYDWHRIKENAFDLGYVPKGDNFNSYDNSSLVIERNSSEYQKYRDNVFKRDKVCQCCGSSENLEVHHPLPFKKYNSIGADTNNGIVLCKECHTEYHSQNGYKRNCNPITLAQFLRDYAKPFQLDSSLVDAPISLDISPGRMGMIKRNVRRQIRAYESDQCPKEFLISELGPRISQQEVELGIQSLIQEGRIYMPKLEHYTLL